MVEAIVTGIIQGISEWLPVSSEGLIVLVKIKFFNCPDNIDLIIRNVLLLHFGTFLSALVYFRKYIWSKGIRGYRVSSNIKGRPDLYFPRKNITVFIDGCFWHKCPRCFIKPRSNKKYWKEKIKNNIKRDKQNTRLLQNKGIHVIRIWEHQIKDNINKCYQKLLKVYEKEI